MKYRAKTLAGHKTVEGELFVEGMYYFIELNNQYGDNTWSEMVRVDPNTVEKVEK